MYKMVRMRKEDHTGVARVVENNVRYTCAKPVLWYRDEDSKEKEEEEEESGNA